MGLFRRRERFPLYARAAGRDTAFMTERLVPMISADEIRARTKELGQQITKDYKDRNLVFV